MTNRIRMTGLVAAMVASAALVGCGSAAEPTAPEGPAPVATEALAEGLTVLKTTSSVAFNAAFKKSTHVIYLQAIRGKLAPAEYQDKDGAPLYEVDARFVADNGRTFYSRKGGDEWLDPTWAADFERQTNLAPTRVSNELLFEMAAEAALQLDVAVPAQLGADQVAVHAPELRAIHDFGERATAMFAEEKLRLADHMKQIAVTATEIPYGGGGADEANRWFGSNYYYIAVHDKSISWSLGLGRHSATRIYQWSGYWSWVADSCNHGSCAGSMGQKCLLQYYEAVSDYKPSFDYQNCKTGYDTASNGGGHNCHDDTRVQLAGFVYGKTNNGYQAWCADGDSSADISGGTEQGGSPECNSWQRKGYNHPSWCNTDYGGATCNDQQKYDGLCDCNCRFADGTGADPDCTYR